MSDKRRFSDMDQTYSRSGPYPDHPPYSRLFIICSKAITEDTIRDKFGGFGNIEEVWMVKDRVTGDYKGVVYVKYSLTSEAAKAVEEMNGKILESGGRPIKVLIAHSRGEGSKKESLEEERLLRLFVICQKNATEEELEEHFKEFGEIDNIKLVKNRESNENKGFAYVKYFKMVHAALAYENCDRNYRPKFAEPKPQGPRHSGGGYDDHDDRGRGQYKMGHMGKGSNPSYNGDSFTKLQILVSPIVTQEQLWRLCDIAPGLEYCRLFNDFRPKSPYERLTASVAYSTPEQAAHARERLNGFEYPPGLHLTVRADRSDPGPQHSIPPFPLPSNNSMLSKTDIEMLAENVKQALLKAGTGLKGLPAGSYDQPYCSAKLPDPRNFDDEEPPTDGSEARLFIVFNPSIPERHAIKDVFGRFGRITDLFLLIGKNVGYITYARKESVKEAIAALHSQELCGMFMKVMEAEPRSARSQPNEDRRKRIRMGEDE